MTPILLYPILDYIHGKLTRLRSLKYVNDIHGNKLNVGAAGANATHPPPRLNSGKLCDIVSDTSSSPPIEFCDITQSLPYSNKEFDVIYVSHVIEHIEPHLIPKALTEFERISKHTVIVIPHYLSATAYAHEHKSIIYHISPYILHIQHNPFPLHRNTPQSLIITYNPLTFKVYQ